MVVLYIKRSGFSGKVLFEQFLICNAMQWVEHSLTAKRNGYLTFQTIIDIAGAHGAISDAVCMGSSVLRYSAFCVSRITINKLFDTILYHDSGHG